MEGKERQQFFLEKKNQKTFMSSLAERSGLWREGWELPGKKVFCFFSSEKKSLPSVNKRNSGDGDRG
jgi:hypothetical protein